MYVEEDCEADEVEGPKNEGEKDGHRLGCLNIKEAKK